jgi:deoxyribodipyrimidine photo-lyase
MKIKDTLKLRIKKLNSISFSENQIENCQSVIYIMSRDQRIQDNFALIAAYKHYKSLINDNSKIKLIIAFNIYPNVKNRVLDQYEWMIEGLKKLQKNLEILNISFLVSVGNALDNYKLLETKLKPAAIYFDFSPLKGPIKVKKEFSEVSKVPLYVVDTHNIIPVWEASSKEEFGAHTIRPKIFNKIHEYLKELEEIGALDKNNIYKEKIKDIYISPSEHDWKEVVSKIKVEKLKNYEPIVASGEEKALTALDIFLNTKLINYSELRNIPSENYQSNLSAYLHFGQISSLRIVLELKKFLKEKSFGEITFSKDRNKASKKYIEKNLTTKQKVLISAEAFVEELIVRKELSDNFCFYNTNYDNFNGLKDWAKKTLNEHKKDLRKEIYSLEELEFAKTYDEAWNASQKQLLKTGKIHGYMRMYWAKKILEWSEAPEQAIENAIYLNDKYSLDGYDPNGYVGTLWSIGGIHDRAWFEREIFGKVRYMNAAGLKRKFDIEKYIKMWS